MKSGDIYGVQTFVRDGRGRLAQARFTPCKSSAEACRYAEGKVEQGAVPGAVAFLRRGGGEFDEGELITVAVYGSVPPDVKDALPF
ncbi:hypothetical protein MMB17_07280 [Methylobacterium organophilum]|uniref:hypothetical protein n=1 Tax=Methylobacterium organophilum TaxID=410 RepID=UPI001F12C238|nr:hypothetical protein [Methylobacterium organophilum]UMY19092.1 hypothetical protein MMB17_07280 [Methylobacterium organophilum]